MLYEIVSWMNINGSAVTAIATVVLAIITGFYLMETRKQNSIAVRPYLQLELMPETTKEGRFLFLYVKNIGRGPLVGLMIKVLEPHGEFSKIILLAVGEQKRIQLDKEEKYQKRIEIIINIKYDDIYGKKYQDDFPLETHISDAIKIYREKDGKGLTKDE
ncbi:Uncharacterised protein [uncultured archaeon]|nr:Uncharacterised protein [uncultured archaeon]